MSDLTRFSVFLRGSGKALRDLAASLRGLKGLHTGELNLAETAESPTRALQSHDQPH
jgi:hypothetical protein